MNNSIKTEFFVDKQEFVIIKEGVESVVVLDLWEDWKTYILMIDIMANKLWVFCYLSVGTNSCILFLAFNISESIIIFVTTRYLASRI